MLVITGERFGYAEHRRVPVLQVRPVTGARDVTGLAAAGAARGISADAGMVVAHGNRSTAYGIMVLTTDSDRIAEITGFADPALFPAFGLPGSLER